MHHMGSRVMMERDTMELHGVGSSQVKTLTHRACSNRKVKRLEAEKDSLSQ